MISEVFSNIEFLNKNANFAPLCGTWRISLLTIEIALRPDQVSFYVADAAVVGVGVIHTGVFEILIQNSLRST